MTLFYNDTHAADPLSISCPGTPNFWAEWLQLGFVTDLESPHLPWGLKKHLFRGLPIKTSYCTRTYMG